MSEETKELWIGKLWERKLPQFLGTYLAVGFGLLQFLEFVSNRYYLRDFWVDKYLIVWLALIPAFALLIYFGNHFHRTENKSKLRLPKFLIFGNTVVALLLGIFLFNRAEATQSEVVELTDEEGKVVTAVVPFFNKIKTIASFQFKNLTGDEEHDWLGVAFSNLLQLNLNQRPEFYATSELTLNGYYDGLGLTQFEVPSIGMQREIAQKSRNDYFTRLSFDIVDDHFIVKGNLYSTKNGKEVIDLAAQNNDLYKLIDNIKEQVIKNIPDAFGELENQISLPASTLISSNPEALQYFTKSRIAFYRNPIGLEEVVTLAKKAVELDPTCSLCHFYVGDPLYGQGKRDEAISYIKNAIKYGESLPERMQFRAKEVLYSVTGRMDAYIKLQELKRKMFPYEFGPYYQLSSLYRANYGIDSAKFLIQEAIDNGNVEKGLVTLYGLELFNEEYEEAEKTLNRLNEEFPDRDEDKLKYATLYDKQGKIKEAKEILLEEEMLDPLNAQIQIDIARLEFRDLNVDAAFRIIENGINQATTLSDSIALLGVRFDFLAKTGQIKKALSALKEHENYVVKRAPINRVVVANFLSWVDMYQSIGQPEKISYYLEELKKYSPESAALYNCLGNTNALEKDYVMTMDFSAYQACRGEYQAYGDGLAEMHDVLQLHKNGSNKDAIVILEADDARIKKLFSNKYFLSKVYAMAGKEAQAEGILDKALSSKTDNPILYYKIASLLEKKNPKKASAFLETAMKFWDKADAEYIPAQRAKTLSDRLTQ